MKSQSLLNQRLEIPRDYIFTKEDAVMSFEQKLKELRLENKMTQKYVAARLNVARSTIAVYETKNRQPSHEKLTALANLFQVSVDYLLDSENTVQLDSSRRDFYASDEKTLLVRYSKLSSKSRKDLMEYISLLELRDKN